MIVSDKMSSPLNIEFFQCFLAFCKLNFSPEDGIIEKF